MTLNKQRTINTNDISVISSYSLNNSTSTTISSANIDRIFINISNISSHDVWIKLQAASVDNTKKGICVMKGTSWAMPIDNIYTGEISAISDTDSPTIYITEY